MMPGGTPEAYKYIEPIVTKVAAQVRCRAIRWSNLACLRVLCMLAMANACWCTCEGSPTALAQLFRGVCADFAAGG
jgi:hypothetical protein